MSIRRASGKTALTARLDTRNMSQADKYAAAVAHLNAGRLTTAEAGLRAVAAANPHFAPAHYDLGVVLKARGKLRPAAFAFQAAVRAAPDLAQAHAALGLVTLKLGEASQAEVCARQAVALDAGLRLGWIVLGDALRAQLRLREARTAYDRVLATAPADGEARLGRAFAGLLAGDLAAGWADYEHRPARQARVPPALMPQWRGEDPAGKRILIYAEQGLGDSLQFLRYAQPLAERGAHVLAAVPIPIMDLARGAPGVAEIVEPGPRLPRFDACAPLPSLPYLFRTTLETIPAADGYLTAPPEDLAHWRPRLAADDAPVTAGICWAGNPEHPNDANRSMRLADLAPLLAVPGVRWLNLQMGEAAAPAPRRVAGEILTLGRELRSLSDTAAIIAQADLVISVDTALCHLAGAMGRPTWTLLPLEPDWRWLTERSNSPWYAAMRLFRQPAPGDWASVAARVADELAALVAARRRAGA